MEFENREVKMKKFFSVILLPLLSVMIFTTNSFATGDQNCLRKGARGVCNVGLGFLEVPQNVGDVGAEQGPIAAASYGLLLGLAKTAERMAVGAYEAVTFLIPPYGPVLKDPEFFGETDKDITYPVTSGISGIVHDTSDSDSAE